MEQLTESVSVSFEVSSIPNNPDCPHPRFAQYKARNNVPDQQERRRRLLEEQKQKRSESFNTSRGLIEDLSDFTGEHDMEWTATKAKPRLRKYKNKLMLSEWLVHIPEDLAELWYLVPCPKGRRTLVVATGGHTQAFLKNGCLKSTYQSALPGGNRDDVKGCTILDCIWNTANCSYYVLDVLAWSNQPLLDCETEFRFYWLKSKLEEISCLSKQSKENAYAFISLPYHQCDISTMTNIMATENLFGQEGPALDGLLFYHSQAHYIPGITPLVGWLKPHMMPEVLGLPVAPVYLQEEMESDKKLGRKKCRRFHKHQGKSQQDVTSDNDSTTEMETNIKPKQAVPRNGLPMWNEMALDAKLPMCKMPNGTIVLSRDKIGRKLWKTKKDNKFRIYDPNCIEVGYQYNALHDEHLKPFFSRKVNRDYMLKLGLINEEGEVICTLKQFNEYRRYLKRLLLYDFENALERRDEAEREYNLFAKSKAFGIIDLDHELKISIRKEKMKDSTEKILLEAKERKERCIQRRKLYAERVMKLARRKEEEARQRIVKARLQDDKICNRIAMAKELKRRNNIVTIRHWNESEAQRQSRMKRQHLEDAIRNNTKLAEFWENKKQQQMEKIIKNKKIIEEYLTNQEIGIAIRNKLMQEETFYMEQRLYEIKSKNSKDKIKAVAKTKQKAIEMAVTKAWGSKRASMALSGKKEKMMVAESVQAALSVFRGDPGVGDIYRVLEGAKAKLERIVDVPEPVNLAIDALLEKVITVHVQKNVANILNDVFLKTEESAITPVEEGRKNTITNSRISTLSTKRDTGRCSPKSLNIGSRNQSYTLHKGMGSILRVQRGVSFGNVQTVERIPTNSDLRSIKDRPPTPVPSLTELAEAVFNEPIIMTEFELGELSTEKNSLNKLFQALTKHLLANVKKRTEKSIESKQKLLYHPTIALGRSDVTKRITQAILLRHNDDIMNSEEIQNAIDCLVRDLLCAYQKAQRGSTSSTRAQLKVLSEANPTLFESENEDNQHG